MNMSMPQPVENYKIRLSFVGNPVIETPAPVQVEEGVSSSDLKIRYSVHVVINRPESQVDVVVTMTYFLGARTLFSGKLTTSYQVVDLASFITAKEGEDTFRIECDFLPMLVSIAFGNARGFFARELVGSVLEPYPFPMISMDSLQKKTSYELI